MSKDWENTIRQAPDGRPGGLTPERRAGLLAYCKLTELADDPEVQALIPLLYEAAVDYLAGAGASQPPPDTTRAALYDLCVNHLVLDGWDRREVSITGTTVTENLTFRRYLNQLKWTGGAGV